MKPLTCQTGCRVVDVRLKCLGSSSRGNCYLLESDRECLVLEAGLPFKEVKKALGFNISKIVGLLVTHEHGDHCKYTKDYHKAGIEIRMSKGTADNMEAEFLTVQLVNPGYWYQLGGFTITPFPVIHDAAEPFGYVIRHQEIGTLLFISDTEYVKQNFKKLQPNHIMIECNYSQKIIDARVEQGNTVKVLRDRVLTSHMELETCKEFIRQNKTVMLDNVILLHLSDGHSDEKQFVAEVQEVVGGKVNVFAADKGLEVNLDVIPF